MLLDPGLGYYDEGLDLSDVDLYRSAQRSFGDATTLPPASYRSKVFSSLEDNCIWSRNWIAVGVGRQIPDSGDLLPFSVGFHGIHVQREADGTFTGRFNKAQHGGCRSVPLQCQTGSRTKCSFTSCGFSRDRDVIPAAELDSDRNAAQQYLGLRPERLLPVRVATSNSIIFVCLDPNAPPLTATATVTEAGAACADAGPDAGLLASDWTRAPANWKLIGTAFGDVLAPTTGRQPSDMQGGLACEDWPAAPLSEFLLGDDGEARGDRSAAALRFGWLFPNLLLLSSPGLTLAMVLQPLSMSETQLRTFILSADGLHDRADDKRSHLSRKSRELVAAVCARAGELQAELETWGTPGRPGTASQSPPLQADQLGWVFQNYLIDSISAIRAGENT